MEVPLADPFIAFWNAYAPFQIARVQDWTDLIALIVLPFAACVRIAPRRMRKYALASVLSAVAVVAFERVTGRDDALLRRARDLAAGRSAERSEADPV